MNSVDALRSWRGFLPERDRLYEPVALILIGLLILGVLLMVLTLLLPLARTRGELVTQITDTQQAVALEGTLQAQAPTRIAEQIRAAEASIDEAATAFLSEPEATTLLNRLYQYARVSDVTITDLNAQSAPSIAPDGVSTALRFQVQASGTLPRLMNFLARVEETVQSGFALNNVVIQPELERHIASMDVVLYVSAYAEPSDSPVVTPSPIPSPVITGTVVVTPPSSTTTPTRTTLPPVPIPPLAVPTVPLLPAMPPAQEGCTDLVVNGGFEHAEGWLLGPSITPPQATTEQQHVGLRAMQLGYRAGQSPIGRSSYSSIRQLVTIPATANSVTLAWWQWTGTREAPTTSPNPASDRQEVLLLTTDERVLANVQQIRQNTGSWQLRVADLSIYRGQSLFLYFNVFNDTNDLATWLYLDEVMLRSCSSAVVASPTPTVTPTSSPSATTTATTTAATATLAATATPTTIANCRNLLVNGGFEDSTGWQLGRSVTPPQYTTTQRQAGLRAMQLGRLPDATANRSSYSSVRQPVTIPSSANTVLLRWWQWVGTEEDVVADVGNTGDRQEVLLLTADDQIQAAIQRTRQNENGWQQQTADLTAYRGQTLSLYLNVFNDNNDRATWLYIDEVELLDCLNLPTPTVPTATPTTTPTAIPTATATTTATATPSIIPTVPTATSTITPTPDDICVDILSNGGFEANSDWTLGKTDRPAAYTTERQRTGTRSMQLGIPTQDNIEIYSSISQSIAVPTDANIVTLRWWQWSGSEESSTASPDKTDDRQEVMILTPAGNPIEVLRRVRQNESSWQEVAIELNATSYRGRTILLYFNVYNDGANGRTWMYIDDVELIACSPTPTSVPDGSG